MVRALKYKEKKCINLINIHLLRHCKIIARGKKQLSSTKLMSWRLLILICTKNTIVAPTPINI